MRWLIRRGFSPTLARGIAAWVLPVLLTCIFIAIFAWANPIISGWFDRLGTLIVQALDDAGVSQLRPDHLLVRVRGDRMVADAQPRRGDATPARRTTAAQRNLRADGTEEWILPIPPVEGAASSAITMRSASPRR